MSEVVEKSQTAARERRESPDRREQSDASQVAVIRPPADICEHADGITLLLDMPGVSKERLGIQADRSSLVVEGTVEIDMPRDTEPLHADVRSTHYRRTFSLSGEQLDTDAVSASLQDGVLRIDIPKRAEMRPRKIEVRT